MSGTRTEEPKVSKREFVQRVSQRTGLSLRVTQLAYDAIFDEILDLVNAGNRVTLTGFGRFYAQSHKGHDVVLNIRDDPQARGRVDDYAVLKFSATREVNKRITARGEGERGQRSNE
ncbi:HU family DNA-binding protein [uncultured Microbacterium sp.]|uniref:HU family DNA-binding protein n=1 Tax=uncultured Microbacterium sp. TaxID=191216 RepID=UPI0025E9A075|nr:HU family DNA-binding protein [uncultured Microbacterium sp.]